MLRRGTDGGEHAELAEPTLRDTAKPAAATSEASSRKTVATENIASGSGRPRRRSPSRGARPRRAGRVSPVAVDRAGIGVDQNRDGVRRACGGRGDESELVAQMRGFSTMPTTVRRPAVEGQRRSDLEPEEVGHAVGDGDLPGPTG